MTNSIQDQLATMQIQTPTQSQTASTTMGKDDFLKLLVQQLENQDPMNPMDGTQFASQLAQFSSVEQLSNINTNLTQNMNATATMTASINNALAATFIGKEVRAATSQFNYTGSGNVKMGYSLGSAANTSSVSVYDSAGNLVKNLSTGGSSGDNTLTWDGKNDAGVTMAAGSYTFKVDAKDGTGASLTSTPYVYGTVTGVRFKSDGTVFVIDGEEVSLASILEILQE